MNQTCLACARAACGFPDDVEAGRCVCGRYAIRRAAEAVACAGRGWRIAGRIDALAMLALDARQIRSELLREALHMRRVLVRARERGAHASFYRAFREARDALTHAARIVRRGMR